MRLEPEKEGYGPKDYRERIRERSNIPRLYEKYGKSCLTEKLVQLENKFWLVIER